MRILHCKYISSLKHSRSCSHTCTWVMIDSFHIASSLSLSLSHTHTHTYMPQLSLEKLVRHGVHCLKPDYIAEYLSKGVEIEMESLYINEVKPLLQR